MKLLKRTCVFCKKEIYRSLGRLNEAKKFHWKIYCSRKCQAHALRKRKQLTCARTDCQKIFVRTLNEIRSKNQFCSSSCAAIINNSQYPKRIAIISKCHFCYKKFKGDRSYCSRECKNKGSIIPGKLILKKIIEFYHVNERIPVKREFLHYNVARSQFGTWNKAVEAAGFKPNPVLFAERQIANDGHVCDSLSEKIIDDWFYKHEIPHEIHVPYPARNSDFTCDFLVHGYHIEFFGLDGEHPRYTEIAREKRLLAKKLRLKFIELNPKHLFPKNKLDSVLNFLIKSRV